MFGLLRVAAGINILALVGVCVFLLWNEPGDKLGVPDRAPRRMMTAGGVWPLHRRDVPAGFRGHADSVPARRGLVYLHEYGGKGRYPLPAARHQQPCWRAFRGVQAVRAGVLRDLSRMGVSLLAGVLTLAVLTLPVIINTTEEARGRSGRPAREAASLPSARPAARPLPALSCPPPSRHVDRAILGWPRCR